MKKAVSIILAALLCVSGNLHGFAVDAGNTSDKAQDALYQTFENPPLESKSRPLWFWNSEGRKLSNITKQGIRDIMVNSKEQSGYYGFGILPNWLDNYMSEDYLELYGYALETAKELGLKMCLYDEDGYPSGTAGGILNREHPESTLKRLDKAEKDVAGPQEVILEVPAGAYRTYLGAVAFNTDTNEIIDISDKAVFMDEKMPGVYASSAHAPIPPNVYTADQAFDGDYTTRWNAASYMGTDQWLQVLYEDVTTVDKIVIREALNRIRNYAVQYLNEDGVWTDIQTGTTIGALKEHTFAPVSAKSFRLMIYTTTSPTDSPSIYEMELFSEGAKIAVPVCDNFDRVVWDAPEGNWRVMAFAAVKDGDGLVDYLSKEAVDDFIAVTHDVYYAHFADYFGDVIDSAFYDEPPLYRASGRTWTGRFNELFEAEYGYNPITLYPALWYDIGQNTQAARNALFGFRTELFSTQYIKNMQDWCTARGLKLTGHMDQEENVNPVTANGDLMKIFSQQAIPGVDEISFYDRALKAYKVVSSSANNWDKGLVMTETYGAMGEGVGVPVLYKDIMNQFTRGINFVVPHAIWYDNQKAINNPPELSYRSAKYGPALPAYNDFIGRTSGLLQNSRHVADIGVLYPIATLQARTKFDEGNPYYGVAPEEADYMDVGELLMANIRRDYTFLHPEIIGERCEVDGDIFKLNNEYNYEQFKVFIMPGSKTISVPVLEKIKEFYDAGGKVIATTQLPYKSAEFGRDSDVVDIITGMFGISEADINPVGGQKYSASSYYNKNPQYAPEKAFDGVASLNSRWNAGDRSGGDQWLQVEFAQPVQVNRAVIIESPPYRVTKFRVQYWDGAQFVDCASGTSIGADKELTFDAVTTDKIRLYIDTIVSDSVSIQEFELYYNDGRNLAIQHSMTADNQNDAGGRAVFLGKNYAGRMQDTLDEMLEVYDVEIDSFNAAAGGSFTYIHKVKDGRDLYYLVNSTNSAVNTNIQIRGRLENPMLWNPHDGSKTPVTGAEVVDINGVEVTRIPIFLESVQSMFIIDELPELPVIDKSGLEVLVQAAQEKAEAAYTAESWAPFAQALQSAVSVLADEGVTQQQVSDAYTALNNAMNALVAAGGGEDIPVTKVKINASGLFTLSVKKRAQIPVTVEPADATDRTVKWISTNTNIFTVDADGNITPHKQGTATLTAESVNGLRSTIIVRITA